MKVNKLLLFIFSIGLFSCNSSFDKNSFAQLEWIEQTWRCQSGNTVFYEQWNKTNDHTLKGINFSICNGQIIENDSSFIELKGTTIEFRSGKSKWLLESIYDNSFRFSNHDFGEEIKYVSNKKEEATVQLTFPNRNVRYTMTRVADLPSLLKKATISGDYFGSVSINNKPELFSLSFINDGETTHAFITTADSAIVHQEATSSCLNITNSSLTFLNNNSPFSLQFDIINNLLKGTFINSSNYPFTLEKSSSANNKISPISSTIFKTTNSRIVLNKISREKTTSKNALLIIGESNINGLNGYNSFAYKAASQGIAVYTYKQNYLSSAKSYYENLYIDYDKAAIEASEVLTEIRKENLSVTVMAFGIGNFVADKLISNGAEINNLIAISPPSTTFQSLISTESLRNLYMRNTKTESAEACKEVWNAIFIYLTSGKDGLQVQKAIDNAWQEGWGSYCLPQELPDSTTLKKYPLAKNLNSDFIINRGNFNIPLTALYGEKDVMMNVKENAELLDQQFTSKKSLLQIRIYGDADHHLESTNLHGTSFTKSFSNELYTDLWKLFK